MKLTGSLHFSGAVDARHSSLDDSAFKFSRIDYARLETVAALASLGELAAILRSDSGRNTIFTLDVEGVGASEVMFADRQIDPVCLRGDGVFVGVKGRAYNNRVR